MPWTPEWAGAQELLCEGPVLLRITVNEAPPISGSPDLAPYPSCSPLSSLSAWGLEGSDRPDDPPQPPFSGIEVRCGRQGPAPGGAVLVGSMKMLLNSGCRHASRPQRPAPGRPLSPLGGLMGTTCTSTCVEALCAACCIRKPPSAGWRGSGAAGWLCRGGKGLRCCPGTDQGPDGST